MSAKSPALVRSFNVGKRTVTLTIPRPKPGTVAMMVVEWAPSPPRRLSRRELRQYRAGRDAALAELARATGMNGLVIEV